MAVQVVAAPVMMVGKVAATVVKTTASIAMKTGTAIGKATMTAAKSAGTALKSGFAKTVSTAGQASKSLLTAVKSSPLSSKFASLAKAKGSAARMASQSAGKTATQSAVRSAPQAARSTPVGQSVQQGLERHMARQRMRMPRQGHPVDQRDRQVNARIMQVMAEEDQEKQLKNPFVEIALKVLEKARKTMAANRSAARPDRQKETAFQIAAQQRHRDQSPQLTPQMER